MSFKTRYSNWCRPAKEPENPQPNQSRSPGPEHVNSPANNSSPPNNASGDQFQKPTTPAPMGNVPKLKAYAPKHAYLYGYDAVKEAATKELKSKTQSRSRSKQRSASKHRSRSTKRKRDWKKPAEEFGRIDNQPSPKIKSPVPLQSGDSTRPSDTAPGGVPQAETFNTQSGAYGRNYPQQKNQPYGWGCQQQQGPMYQINGPAAPQKVITGNVPVIGGPAGPQKMFGANVPGAGASTVPGKMLGAKLMVDQIRNNVRPACIKTMAEQRMPNMGQGSGVMNPIEFVQQYGSQQNTYTNESKFYNPKKPTTQAFNSKPKIAVADMSHREYDNWYTRQYLEWNKAQVFVKRAPVPIPQQLIPSLGKEDDTNNSGAINQTFHEPVKFAAKPYKRVQPQAQPLDEVKPQAKPYKRVQPQVKPLDEVKPSDKPYKRANQQAEPLEEIKPPKEQIQTENAANRAKAPKPIQQNNVMDVEGPKVTTLKDEGNVLTPNIEELMEDSTKRAQEQRKTNLASDLNFAQEIGAWNFGHNMTFYNFIKSTMDPVMMKRVPDSIFNGRDLKTGHYTRTSYTADPNPCRDILNKLSTFHSVKNNEREMINIRNKLAECIEEHKDYFYNKQKKSEN